MRAKAGFGLDFSSGKRNFKHYTKIHPQQGVAPSQQSGLPTPPAQIWPDPRQFVGKIWLLAVIVWVQPPAPGLSAVVEVTTEPTTAEEDKGA